MEMKDVIKPLIGAALIYAANKVKGIPEIARLPLAVVGTVMLAKSIPVVRDQIA